MRYVKKKLYSKKKDLDFIKENNIIEWYNTLKKRQHNKMHYLYKTVRYYLLMSKHAYFITFTLNQENINLKKTWLIRVLKKQLNELDTNKWILNDDYGDLNNRLHFHALIFTEHNLLEHKNVIRRKQHYNLTTWDKYGFSQIKPINIPDFQDPDFEKTVKRISKYIVKLTRHALKGTTIKLWYSRNKKDLMKNNKFMQGADVVK